jgi:hypothetical protein
MGRRAALCAGLRIPGGTDFLVENVFGFQYAREVDAVTCIEG